MSEVAGDEVLPQGQELEAASRSSAVTQRAWPLPWMGAFLEMLARVPNVSAAAKQVGISRQAAYSAAKAYEGFAEAWEEARDVGIDLLEQVALRRATTGETRTVTRTRTKEKTGLDGVLETETETMTETSVYVSDQLTALLLKAYRPETYRERVDHRHTGGDGAGPIQLEVNRKPTRERMLELAKLSVELELPVIEGNGTRLPPPVPEES